MAHEFNEAKPTAHICPRLALPNDKLSRESEIFIQNFQVAMACLREGRIVKAGIKLFFLLTGHVALIRSASTRMMSSASSLMLTRPSGAYSNFKKGPASSRAANGALRARPLLGRHHRGNLDKHTGLDRATWSLLLAARYPVVDYLSK